MKRLNEALADRITRIVGTMWCAYFFTCLAFLGLPAVLGMNLVPSRFGQLVLWVSSEFLQLVLLSVIMVGQGRQAALTEQRDEETHFASMRELEIATEERDLLQHTLDHIIEYHPDIPPLPDPGAVPVLPDGE